MLGQHRPEQQDESLAVGGGQHRVGRHQGAATERLRAELVRQSNLTTLESCRALFVETISTDPTKLSCL